MCRKKIIRTIVNTKWFQRWHKKYTNEHNYYTSPTAEIYAQNGEDVTMNFIFNNYCNKHDNKLTYLDIGVNTPIANDNTYFFYNKGCKGVLVEPNPKMCEEAKKHRPNDTVVCAGIAFGEEREAPYYLFKHPYEGWSGFDESRVSKAEKVNVYLEKVFNQKLIPINEIFEKYFKDEPPTICSIDVEGFEDKILESIDFSKYRPVIFCLESDQTDFTPYAKHPIIDIMAKNGYLYMANTSINMIFLEKSYFSMDSFFWAK